MRLSDILNSAVKTISHIPPASIASGLSAVVAFLASLVLLQDSLGDAAASVQFLATGVGGLIAAYLASRLAAYLMGLAAAWAGWPDLSRGRQWLVALLVALAAAAFVMAIMVLVS
jgi:hypothetical protein